MVFNGQKKDVITKTENSTIDRKEQTVVKEENSRPARKKILYKAMINDIKKNTNSMRISKREGLGGRR